MSKLNLITCLALVGSMSFTSFASAQDSSPADAIEKINSANELVRQGKFGEAIDEYQQVTPSPANRDKLKYNQAVAQFRNGDIAAAQTMFAATAKSNNPSIAASSRYNLGNCIYSAALQTAEQDKQAAIDQLRGAISQYRDSLRLNNDNADARANIELAAEMIRRLKEEQEQEEQQQQNQDQEQQNQEQQNQEQQNQDQQNQDQQNQDQQNQDQQNQEQQNQEQQNQEQQNQSEESESNDQQSDSQQQPSESESPQQDQQQSNEQQQSNPDDQSQAEGQDDQDQKDDAQTPKGQLTSANEQDKNGKPQQAAMADPNAKDRLMTKEEAMKMLQAVRDRDMLRRIGKERRERSRHIPVDKDW